MSNRIPRTVGMIKGNGFPIVSFKKDRNAPCTCGSGKKQKRCCGTETKFHHSRPDKETAPKPEQI